MDTSGGRTFPSLLVPLVAACLFAPVVLGSDQNNPQLQSTTDYIRRHSTVELKCYADGLEDNFFEQQDNFIDFLRGSTSTEVRVVRFSPGRVNQTDPRYQVRGARLSGGRYLVSVTIPSNIGEDADFYQCGVVIAGEWRRGSPKKEIRWMTPAPAEYPRCDAATDAGISGNIVMKCSSTGIPAPTLIWYSDNDTVGTRYDELYSTGIYQNEISVNATNIRDSYVCRYSYTNGGETDERSCWLGKPRLTLLATTDGATYMTGEAVEVIAVAHAQPPMSKPLRCTWDYRGDKTGFSVRNDSNELATISIANVQPDMSGSSIVCSGSNFLGDTSESVMLVIEDIQEENLTASVTTEDLHVTIGDSMTLNCELGFTPPVSDVSIDWYHDGLRIDPTKRLFKDRFNITEPRRQLIMTFETPEDHESDLHCVVRFGKRAVSSREFKVLVHPDPRALPSVQAPSGCPYSLESPIVVVPVFFCILGVFACIFILSKLLCVLCRRRRNRSQSMKIEHVGGAEMRTSSFGSSVSSEHHFERADMVVTIPDKSGLLKRPPSLPSSRCLPSVPRSSASLTPVHEYESTPRNETYSLIKPDMRAAGPLKCPPNESNQQAYMDMGRNSGVNSDLPSDYLTKIATSPGSPPSPPSDIPEGAVGGIPPPLPIESPGSPEGAWYLEVKKKPDQFNDLEDLYRETARNNVYTPPDNK